MPVIIQHDNHCVKLSDIPELLEHFDIKADTTLEVWSLSLSDWRSVRANQWIRLDGSAHILARVDQAGIGGFAREITILRSRSLQYEECKDLIPPGPLPTWDGHEGDDAWRAASYNEPTESVGGIGHKPVSQYLRNA